MPDTLAQLRADYTALDSEKPVGEDQAVSLRLHRVDVSLDTGGPVTETSRRIVNWVTMIRRIEDQVITVGVLPRENRRRRDSEDQRPLLAPWLTRQRSAATRAHHCTYQTLRLQLLPDFDWKPLHSAWATQFEQYRWFIRRHRRVPLYRQARERALARWAARQRTHYRDGVLAPVQIDALETLPIWHWGPA